jgi:hypothetical protein
MRQTSPSKDQGLSTLDRRASVAVQAEPLLNITSVYQDPLTHEWCTELWERVEPLIGRGGTCRKAWSIGRLAEPFAFEDAVEAAAEADVLVISVRAAGDLPLMLRVWIDAWLPRRAGRSGALVALIGLSSRPDAPSSRAHQYFQTVARQGGLDFLPRERKLPDEPLTLSVLPPVTPAANITPLWPTPGPGGHFGAAG